MKILFHSNQLGLRGTEVSLYDYAHYNEKILNNQSIVVSKRISSGHHPLAKEKFSRRFKVFYYDSLDDLQKFADAEKADIFYCIKSGENDGLLLKEIKNCVHAVFQNYEPHGDVYAYISEWLSKVMSKNNTMMPYVPHMIDLPACSDENNLRKELNIPEEAVVFGCYGGNTSFDIAFARKLVYSIARKRPHIYFLFMGMEDFVYSKNYYPHRRSKLLNKLYIPIYFFKRKLDNIIFLEGSVDLDYKVKFIKTCDAMLHARSNGESFGLACGEFSILNKPVITCDANSITDRCHIDILGAKGIYYSNYNQLEHIINNFEKYQTKNFDAYSKCYNPEAVMAKFKKVFID